MLYRRDYVGGRTAAEPLSSSSLQRYEEILRNGDTILTSFRQNYILFCRETDTILTFSGVTDTILTSNEKTIATMNGRSAHSSVSGSNHAWHILPQISRCKIQLPYHNNEPNAQLLHAAATKHNERGIAGGSARGAAMSAPSQNERTRTERPNQKLNHQTTARQQTT